MIEASADLSGQEGFLCSPGLTAKYWLSDRFVLRLGADYGWRSNGVPEPVYEDESFNNLLYSEKMSVFALRPGVEYRFLKGTRVSPYAGVEFSYRKKSSRSWYESYTQYQGTVLTYNHLAVQGAWVTGGSTLEGLSAQEGYSQRAFTSLGGNLLLGADFHAWKRLYFGLEARLGFEQMDYERVSWARTVHDSIEHTTVATSGTSLPAGKAKDLSFFGGGAIRAGFWF